MAERAAARALPRGQRALQLLAESHESPAATLRRSPHRAAGGPGGDQVGGAPRPAPGKPLAAQRGARTHHAARRALRGIPPEQLRRRIPQAHADRRPLPRPRHRRALRAGLAAVQPAGRLRRPIAAASGGAQVPRPPSKRQRLPDHRNRSLATSVLRVGGTRRHQARRRPHRPFRGWGQTLRHVSRAKAGAPRRATPGHSSSERAPTQGPLSTSHRSGRGTSTSGGAPRA